MTLREFAEGAGIVAGGAIGILLAYAALSMAGIDLWSQWRDDGGEIEKLKQRIEQLEAGQ